MSSGLCLLLTFLTSDVQSDGQVEGRGVVASHCPLRERSLQEGGQLDLGSRWGRRGGLEAGEAALESGLCPRCLGKLAVPCLGPSFHLIDGIVITFLQKHSKHHVKQWHTGD